MKRSKVGKWLMAVVLVLAAAGGGWWWWRQRAGASAPKYTTVAVVRGDLTQKVTATGTLNPVVNVQVGSQISGTIQKLFVDYNSNVAAGQVIAQIDPATFQANVHAAEGDLANAKAALELAQVNYRRAQELFAQKLIPQSDNDQSLATLHQAEAQVKIKESALAKAKVDLARCTIYSPVDGTVISRSVDVGQTVAASLSAPVLFTIANDLSKMQIDANVAEADIGGVEVGQQAEFSVDAFPDRTFHGQVTQIRNSPTTVQNVVTYDAVIGVNNPELKLRPGMTANVAVITAQRNEVLKVANAALRFRPPETGTNAAPVRVRSGERSGGGRSPRGERRSSSRTVYVLKDGRPVAAPVKVGISDGVMTEIVEGLSETDVVITAMTVRETKSEGPRNPFGGGMPRRF